MSGDALRLLAYAGLAAAAWTHSRHEGSYPKLGRVFSAAAILALFLGLAGVLDLGGELTSVARRAANEEGWYADRRRFQGLVILGVLVLTIALIALALSSRRESLRLRLVFISFLGILGLVTVRLVSLHQVDWLLYGSAGPSDLRNGDVLELALVLVTTCQVLLLPKADQPASP